MSQNASGMPGSDLWVKAWADMMSQVMSGQAAQGSKPSGFAPPSDAARQMRDAFLEAWGRQCEEFMKTDAFMDMMKKTMDQSLAFRQQMNQFLQKGLQTAQAPSRADTGDIMQFLHSFEERVLDQLDHLTKRVDAMEARNDKAAADRAKGRSASSAKGGEA